MVFKAPKEAKKAVTGRGGDTTEHIPGTWYAIERASAGWWLRPASTDAKRWAEVHPDRMVSGCLEAATRHLEQAISF